MSFVLVVVAAITLVIGLLQSGLAIIYVSIACSVLAGIVLATAVLRGRPEPRGAGAPAPQRATAGAPPASAPASWVAPDQTPAPAPAPQPVTAGAAGGGVAVAERDDDRTQSFDRVEVEEFDPDDDFPIHGYDRLRATEILPMLAELSDDQLEAVEERERSGKSRAMVLNRIEAQKQSRAEAAEAPEEPAAWDADDEGWEAEPEPTPVPVGASDDDTGRGAGPMAPRPTTAAVGEFPIPDYDDLKALEVLGRLPDLSVSQLHLVRRREEDGFRRAMVLNRIDRLIEEAPPEPEPVVVPPRRRAPAKRAAAKAPAKRAPRKAPAKRAPRKAPAFAAPAVDEPPAPPAKRARTAKAATVAPAKRAAAPRKAAGSTKSSASTRKSLADSPATTAKKVAATRKAGPAKRATKKR